MIIYNVTVNIDESVHLEWLSWMRLVHIPEVMQTGCFLESKLAKIHGEEHGGVSYSIQYLALNEEMLESYQQNFATELQGKHAERYSGKFVAFRTLLSVIEVFQP